MAIFRRKFSDRDKKSFFTQLHTLICSGLDFSRAFGLLIECAEGAEKELYSRVFGRVVAGEELWRALGTSRYSRQWTAVSPESERRPGGCPRLSTF